MGSNERRMNLVASSYERFVHLKTLLVHQNAINDLALHPSVHQAEDTHLLFELQCPKPVLCVALARNGLLYTDGEDRNITAWDIKCGRAAYCIEEAHIARVKGIVVLSDSNEATENPTLLAQCKTQSMLIFLVGSCLNLNSKQSQARKFNPKVEDQ